MSLIPAGEFRYVQGSRVLNVHSVVTVLRVAAYGVRSGYSYRLSQWSSRTGSSAPAVHEGQPDTKLGCTERRM